MNDNRFWLFLRRSLSIFLTLSSRFGLRLLNVIVLLHHDILLYFFLFLFVLLNIGSLRFLDLPSSKLSKAHLLVFAKLLDFFLLLSFLGILFSIFLFFISFNGAFFILLPWRLIFVAFPRFSHFLLLFPFIFQRLIWLCNLLLGVLLSSLAFNHWYFISCYICHYLILNGFVYNSRTVIILALHEWQSI